MAFAFSHATTPTSTHRSVCERGVAGVFLPTFWCVIILNISLWTVIAANDRAKSYERIFKVDMHTFNMCMHSIFTFGRLLRIIQIQPPTPDPTEWIIQCIWCVRMVRASHISKHDTNRHSGNWVAWWQVSLNRNSCRLIAMPGENFEHFKLKKKYFCIGKAGAWVLLSLLHLYYLVTTNCCWHWSCISRLPHAPLAHSPNKTVASLMHICVCVCIWMLQRRGRGCDSIKVVYNVISPHQLVVCIANISSLSLHVIFHICA